ncbi:hypothetical protein GLYMA_05G007402v4 [Glycine max]|nr:hypothetical protein GLYMA_05G007402v4 [Glycine max]KAH1132204.1 hypothetical protein GYH30_011187 [Glycine max]
MSSQPYPLAFPFLFIFSHLGDWFQVLLITSRKKVLPEMRCFAGKVMLMILTRLWTFMYPRPIQGNAKLTNLMNWSCAMGYGVGSGSPLCPSFNFNLEIVKSSQVKNPLEENSVVGITNYIDFGFELQTCVDDAIAANNI